MDQHTSRQPLDLKQVTTDEIDLDTTFSELDALIEPELRQEQAHLNLFKCPYEHQVISNHDLHPRLKTLVDEISRVTKLARVNAGIKTWWIGGIILPNPIFYFSLAGCIVTDLAVFAKHMNKEESGESIARSELVRRAYSGDSYAALLRDDGGLAAVIKNSRPDGLTRCPYRAASDLTRHLGKVIKEIEECGEQPFQRDDCANLLRSFDCGIVDNVGNIVLIKSPEASQSSNRGLRSFYKFLQFAQPFQRARFEL